MTEKEIQHLALKFLKGQTTKEEEALLHLWYEGKGNNDEKIIVNTDKEINVDVRDRLFRNIKSEIQNTPKLRKLNKSRIKRTMYYAASLFMIISLTSLYFYLKENTSSKIHYTQLLNNDVGPGGNNAILELADGTKINLDEATIGNLANMHGLVINKVKEGVLVLEIESFKEKEIHEINTIQTPRGGQYRVKLPDGTMVWLNASSTIKFPNVFGQNSREVELEGEAYFEVAHIRDKEGRAIPFFVNSHQQQIEVLGTHFNVNNYFNEKTAKTTLIEGSVRVLSMDSQIGKLLKPGQRSLVHNGNIEVEIASIESDVSWKNGDFIFDKESLESIMRKIERWYDVEIIYEGSRNNRTFSGAVSRSKNLSEVLKIIELTGKVQFKIEGRRVVVMT